MNPYFHDTSIDKTAKLHNNFTHHDYIVQIWRFTQIRESKLCVSEQIGNDNKFASDRFRKLTFFYNNYNHIFHRIRMLTDYAWMNFVLIYKVSSFFYCTEIKMTCFKLLCHTNYLFDVYSLYRQYFSISIMIFLSVLLTCFRLHSFYR